MWRTELNAAADLLWMLAADPRFMALAMLLLTAAVIDCRSHRIPNWLVVSGALFGVAYNSLFPPYPHANLLWPWAGLALGFAAFLPLYVLRAMGAGDVKLMAMVGAFVGADDVLWAMLYTMIAGGAFAVVHVLARGTAARMLANLNMLFRLAFLDALAGTKPNLQIDAAVSAGKLPYGVAIAAGTLGYLVLHQLGLLH